MRYIVKGYDESVVNVDILGEIRIVGEKVDLEEEVAAPLVAEGKLELLGDVVEEATGDEVKPEEGATVVAEATGEVV